MVGIVWPEMLLQVRSLALALVLYSQSYTVFARLLHNNQPPVQIFFRFIDKSLNSDLALDGNLC